MSPAFGNRVANFLFAANKIAKRTLKEFPEDEIPSIAAAVTFFIFLAMFPAMNVIVWLFGVFEDRTEIVRELPLIATFLPAGGVSVISDELNHLDSAAPQKFSGAFAVNILIAIWSASGGVKSLLDGLNVAYEIKETRGVIHQTLSVLMLTLLVIAVSIVALAAGIVVPTVIARLPGGPTLQNILSFMSWPIAFCVSTLLFSVVYQYGPNHPRREFRAISYGSVAAAALWVLTTIGFKWYALNFGSFNKVYGSLGGIAGFLTWLWLCIVILLLGAEINCEVDRDGAKR